MPEIPIEQRETVSDTQELDRFARQVRPVIERYVSKRVRNRDHAEEIVSRVFEALARTWSTFRGECPTEAYVVFIAANALKNYYSRDLQKLARQISLDQWVETYSLQHDAELACPYRRLEDADWVDDLLTEMNRCCSPVECGVIGMYYQGHTFDQISTLIGMNAATVRGHFLRGRRKLLVQMLLNAPHLLGGEETVARAIERIQEADPGLLSEAEMAALSTRQGSAELLRGAMLKLAPHLEGVLP